MPDQGKSGLRLHQPVRLWATTRTQGLDPVRACARTHQHPHWRDYLLFYEYFHGDSGRAAFCRAGAIRSLIYQ
jgi:hypothetical protein